MKPINFSFEVFNVDGMKNREVTKVAPLEIKINSHKCYNSKPLGLD